ncbi:MAG: M56 family metallopeptidase [Bacteroidales bacterium]|nr:MAG: M56 family metallopeptidase [Bacteroidales bacterium]
MNSWILNYFIESGLSLTVLYFFYWLMLRKLTLFSLNRLVLLGAVVFSFLLPLINISFQGSINTVSPLLNIAYRIGTAVSLMGITINADEGQSFFQSFNWTEIIFYGYLLGVTILTLNLINGIRKVWIMAKTKNIRKFPKYSLVCTDRPFAPFSFMNIIFVNESLIWENQLDKIIAHECAHIEQKHTIDVLIMEFFLTLQWFNPIMWFYRRSLKETHEYLADNSVIISGYNKTGYQRLLLDYIKGLKAIELTNNFNKSLIKKRIAMMTKKQSKKSTYLRVILLVPIVLSLFLIFACSKSENPEKEFDSSLNEEIIPVEQSTVQVDQISKVIPEGEEVFFIVEEMPKFRGEDQEAFREYVRENLKYPESCKTNGISGRVFIQFVVTKDGSIANVNVIRGAHPDLDAEAIRIIETCPPEWTPGIQRGQKVNVAYTFPIVFEL